MKKIILSIIALTTIGLTSFSQNWDEMIKAVSSDRAADDNFGYNVVISGNRALVTSFLEDEDALGGTTQIDAGSVYVFEFNGNVWAETAKLVASDRSADDRFGARASISDDRIIIGAYQEDEDILGGASLTDAGSAYIFELIGGVWTETAKLVASDRSAGNRFGFDVAISGDKAIVGAYYNATDTSGINSYVSAGAAYVFELNGGVWTETAKLVASDRSTYNYFGYSVTMDESKAIIGAQGNKSDALGGGSLFNNAGSVYVFESVGGVWTETAKLVASDRGTNDNFGFDAAISNNKLVVGAFKDGEDALGGNALIDAGSAYVFEFNGGVWTETTKLVASDRGANDQFGFSVDISEDNIVIGVRYGTTDASGGNVLIDAGSAYVFEFANGTWTETTKLVASDRGANDNFGSRVSISGNKAIVGAPFEDEDATGGNTQNDAGSVYIFNTCIANPNVTVTDITLTSTINGAVYQWLDCDNGNSIISSETNQSYTPTVNGNYAVIVTDGSCSDTSLCISITNVGIDYLDLETGLSLYPNPTNGVLNIDYEGEIKSIQVVDMLGRVISVPSSVNEKMVDGSNLSTGKYMIRITTQSDQILVEEFVVQK
ncbi:MAG: hypothetical protein ACJA1C_001593 [Crocinitomicaceae bacterium]|jgi:hypothetical protein